VDIDGFHLPHDIAARRPLTTVAEAAGLRVHVPVLEESDVGELCDRLLTARDRLLETSVARVIGAVDRAARRFLDPDEPARGIALRAIVEVTGYAPAMAALVLDRMAADWLEPALEQLIDVELGGAAALENFVPRGERARARAVGLPLGLHVFAGNVPGVGVTSMIRALLVRSAVLAKTAADEPVLAPLFARLLHEADPAVGDCLAVAYWKGGEQRLEQAALDRVQLVVHYGSGDAVQSLRARAPLTVRFVEHGPRVSCALVRARDSARSLRAAAGDTARAVAIFDQQGCVSPQFVCVIGGPDDARSFAAALADALADVQDELPRGRLLPGEAAAVHELRGRAEFRGLAGEDVRLWGDDTLGYTVVLETHGTLSGSCLNRSVIVRPVASADEALTLLQPLGGYLQTVGVAGFDEDELPALAVRLAGIGATRVTSIPAMPWPPVTWHHDGGGPLRELVRWVDLEA
jgi:hypothetical protein